MEVVYLAAALEDMQWVRRYYAEVFPEGRGHARAGLLKTEALLAENPFVGHVLGDDAEVREFPIARTPFSFLYRVHDGRIEILRVFDQRSFRFGSGLV
jgi:plasmid stabilization system protein ParE